MSQMQNINELPQEQEIDLVELVKRMWINRWLIVKVTAVFMVLGLMVALFSAKSYTASCDIVLQSSDSSSSSSRLSSLASLAGVNLGQMQGSSVRTLSPYVYENIMKSASFHKELMQTVIDFEKAPQPMSFYDYYTSEEYNKPSVMDYVKKYTIGLPSLIIGAIRGKQPEVDYGSVSDDDGTGIENLTSKEYSCMQKLNSFVTIVLDDKKGIITITSQTPEPMATAQLAQAAFDLLQKYITKFKIQKVQSNLDFVQERFDEAKRNFEDIQSRRAKLQDANMNISRYAARAELERLDAEYSIAQNVYSSLAQQLEQAKISVKETTPVLTVINPVTVPYKASKPQRMLIMMAFIFLGGVAGVGAVLIVPAVADITGSEWLKQLVKPLPLASEGV